MDNRSMQSQVSQQNQSQVAHTINSQDKNPFKFIEQALTEAKLKISKMQQTPQILESLPDNDKKKKYLKAENKLLRENLKRMSENVNILIEKMNQEQSRKSKALHGNTIQMSEGGDVPGARSVSPSTTKIDQSAVYADKATLSLMKEHERLKKRLKLIMQPDFLVNLKRDLRITEEEIKQQEKLKRQLKLDQLKREKKLESIMDHNNEPDVMKQVYDTTQRLAFLTEKLQTLERENDKAEEARNQQLAQLEELRNRLTKLNTIAAHYGVNIEKSKENHVEQKKLQEQLDYLNRQKRILQQSIDTSSKKQEMLTIEKKRDLEQLQARKLEVLKKFNDRVAEVRERGAQIKELIERAKTEADPGLLDILEKWDEANNRILTKYPEGADMDYDQLDIPNDNVNQGKTSTAGQGAETDEMQKYLDEIRQKQRDYELQLKQEQEKELARIKAEEIAEKERLERERIERENLEMEKMKQDTQQDTQQEINEADETESQKERRLQREIEEAAQREIQRAQREAEEKERLRQEKERAEADDRLKKRLLDMEAIEKATLKGRDQRRLQQAQDMKTQKKEKKIEKIQMSKQQVVEEFKKKIQK